MTPDYDLFIIGGGIHGVSTARDAAGRGMSVLLAEMNDLASGTSSATTKWHHGGIRYVPQMQFKLVYHALRDRERILNNAPHLSRAMEFIMPQDDSIRNYHVLGAGFLLYDTFAWSGAIPRAQRVDFSKDKRGSFLKDCFTRGYSYGDARTDDSRLVVVNAMDAKEKDAEIMTRTTCTRLEPRQGHWMVTLKDSSGVESHFTAKTVFNASGPWIEKVLAASGLDTDDVPKVDLVKGSHIITKKLYDGDYSFTLQQPDGRVIFIAPFENDFTLIGPTEEKFSGDAKDARMSEAERDYLINGVNKACRGHICTDDILWSYSGVRQMVKKGKDGAGKTPREHLLYVHKGLGADLISVYGGKMTTARTLAEEAVDMIVAMQGKSAKAWTAKADAVLPGGDIPGRDMEAFVARKQAQYAWLPEKNLHRYAYAYGTRMDRFLEGARGVADMGAHYGDGIYEAEIVYLKKNEWAQTAEDVLWRRSKLGLSVDAQTVKNLEMVLK